MPGGLRRGPVTNSGARQLLVVHDYLTQRGGAERVVLSMLRAFPHARLLTSVYEPSTTFAEFADHDIDVLWPSRVGAFRRDHRLSFPILAAAFSSFRTDEDVLCSTSGWAHGVRTSARKTVYCYTPARWLYAPQDFTSGRIAAAALLRVAGPPLRAWDRRAAASADTYLTSSYAVAARIREAYGREAQVLPPPMLLPKAQSAPIDGRLPERYALVVSRLQPYKNVEHAIAAASAVDIPLVIVGRGPERERLSRVAGRDVHFREGLSSAELDAVYAGATVLVAPAREDFGLTPIEAGARGVPVVALAAGGYLETVIDGVTGLLYSPGGLADAVADALARDWDQDVLRAHAETYAEDHFIERLRVAVGAAV